MVNRSFAVMFTSISRTRWTQSTPCHSIYVISISILHSHLHLRFQSDTLRSAFRTNILL